MSFDTSGRLVQRDARTGVIIESFYVLTYLGDFCVATFTADCSALYTHTVAHMTRVYQVFMGHCKMILRVRADRYLPDLVMLSSDTVVYELDGCLFKYVLSARQTTRSKPPATGKPKISSAHSLRLSSDGKHIIARGSTTADTFIRAHRGVMLVIDAETLQIKRLVYPADRTWTCPQTAVCMQHAGLGRRAYEVVHTDIRDTSLITGTTIRSLDAKFYGAVRFMSLANTDNLLILFLHREMVCVDTVAWEVVYRTSSAMYVEVSSDAMDSVILQHTPLCADVCHLVTDYITDT
jgi:hypothetical protein